LESTYAPILVVAGKPGAAFRRGYFGGYCMLLRKALIATLGRSTEVTPAFEGLSTSFSRD
jgi:hypothetical protein